MAFELAIWIYVCLCLINIIIILVIYMLVCAWYERNIALIMMLTIKYVAYVYFCYVRNELVSGISLFLAFFVYEQRLPCKPISQIILTDIY